MHMRIDIHHHYHCDEVEKELLMANQALENELSAVSSVVSTKNSQIASLSDALSAAESGDGAAVSSAVSAAVDAEDNAVAAQISSIIS